jgi:2-keto-4-pentenoate hydratase/2-oxohepta-3-ene-1,7-dioic acid hydratase in catechol pathway
VAALLVRREEIEMKIARFDAGNGPRLGVVQGAGVVDLQGLGFNQATVQELILGGSALLQTLANRAANAKADHSLTGVRLLAPILRPGKYLAIGMNYKKHAEEAERMGIPTPKQQLWFNKQTSCIGGPYDDIDPGVTEKLDYEVELGVVIGKSAKHVPYEKAWEHIFGYFVANDVSARDWQFHSPTFTVGKSFDTHGPIGPWIVTSDEIEDPHTLELKCLVNGQVRQSSNTSQMIYNIFQQIAYLSTAFTLEPGDLLATGTPEGVGASMVPPGFLHPGDVVRCEVSKIGAIENRVIRPA